MTEPASSLSISTSIPPSALPTEEIEKLKDEINWLQSDNAELQKDNAELHKDNAELQKDIVELQNHNAELQKENRKLHEDNAYLTNENRNLGLMLSTRYSVLRGEVSTRNKAIADAIPYLELLSSTVEDNQRIGILIMTHGLYYKARDTFGFHSEAFRKTMREGREGLVDAFGGQEAADAYRKPLIGVTVISC